MNKHERLWSRYWGIRDGHRNGYRMPILRHLALRHDPMAMTELGDEVAHPTTQRSRIAVEDYTTGLIASATFSLRNTWLWMLSTAGISLAIVIGLLVLRGSEMMMRLASFAGSKPGFLTPPPA